MVMLKASKFKLLTLGQFTGQLETEKYLCSYYASSQPS